MGKLFILFFGTCLTLTGFSTTSLAEDITVDVTGDPVPDATSNPCNVGECSLREAIIQANNNSGPDTIILGANTYTLSIEDLEESEPNPDNGDLDVVDVENLTIQGAGQNDTIIHAGDDLDDRVLHIVNSSVIISDLTIENGNTSDNVGGGIYALGSSGAINLTMTNCTLRDNHAGSGGGGLMFQPVSSTGLLIVRGSSFLDNTSTGPAAAGGGLHISGGNEPALIENSIFSGNETMDGDGGGLFLSSFSDIKLSGLQVLNNRARAGSAEGNGGGIFSNDPFVLEKSIIQGNKSDGAGAGVYADVGLEPIQLMETAFQGNETLSDGGGLLVITGSDVLILDSTFNNNSGDDGGGFLIEGSTGTSLEITNSTLSNNRGGDSGGGGLIGDHGFASLNNLTVVGNTAMGGAGILNGDSENNPVTVRNSLFAQNNATDSATDDCEGSFTSGGYNLFASPDNADCDSFLSDPTNLFGGNPMIGPLADNGGPTETHALLEGSPAIDAGNPNGCVDGSGNDLTADQRGEVRPFGPRCDIGAFEKGPVDDDDDNGGGGGEVEDSTGGCSLSARGTELPSSRFTALGILGLTLAALAIVSELSLRKRLRTRCR